MAANLLDPHSHLTQTIHQYAIHLSTHYPSVPECLRSLIATSVVAVIANSKPGYITPETPLLVKDFEATLDVLQRDLPGWAYFDSLKANGDLVRFLVCANPEERDALAPWGSLYKLASEEYQLSVRTVLDQLPIQSQTLAPSAHSTVQDSSEAETGQLFLTKTQHKMSPPKAAMPPPGHVWKKWTLGDQAGTKLERESQANLKGTGIMKHAVSYEDVQHYLVYDVSMNVNEDNLPPAYVILSSELAYKMARFAMDSGGFTMRQLYHWWPANFTSMGYPVTHIEPVGRPALVKLDDGSIAYGMLGGYMYCGSHGVAAMGTDVQKVRAGKLWYDALKSSIEEGLVWSTEYAPDKYDTTAADNEGDYDFERYDNTAVYSLPYQQAQDRYLQGHDAVSPDTQSPTHPARQPYWAALKTIMKRRLKDKPWKMAKTLGVNPLHPLPAIEPQTREPRQSTEDQLDEIFGSGVLANDAFHAHKIVVAGAPEVFESQGELIEWLREHGAEVTKSIEGSTTQLIRCGKADNRNPIVKGARTRPDIAEASEREFLETAKTMARGSEASSGREMTLYMALENTSGSRECFSRDETEAVTPKSVSQKPVTSKATTLTTTIPATTIPNATTPKAVTSKPITRLMTQTIGQVAHHSALVKVDIYEPVKTNHRDIIAKADTLVRRTHEMEHEEKPDLATIREMAEGIASAAKHSKVALVEGYEAFEENKETMISNLAKATDAAIPSNEIFSDDQADTIADKGAKLPGDKICALEAPEAWSKPVPESHLGLKRDLRNGSTMPAKYQTAPLEPDEEEVPTATASLHPRKKRRKEVSPLNCV